MKLFKYDSYDEYLAIQTEANKRKLDWVFAKEEIIKAICQYHSQAEKVICHGARNGSELEFFKKHLNCSVIGTDISSTAKEFDHVIEWDFHNQNKDWLGYFDLVYSNSLDHSFNPNKAVDVWKKQLSENGMLFIEHSKRHRDKFATKIDPFGASVQEYMKMFGFHDMLKFKNRTVLIFKNSR